MKNISTKDPLIVLAEGQDWNRKQAKQFQSKPSASERGQYDNHKDKENKDIKERLGEWRKIW